ncbi:MAG TPA: glycosyltransferase family 1 protein [Actinobacteria bacterium]|nr:glycosyltransferase family 1 protein [Actinomycetota bacterium]
MIDRVAYVSLHTSPLALPGTGDAGGMNVYLDELASAMRRRGIEAVVYTRRSDPSAPREVEAPGGYRVVHLDAGPPRTLPVRELVPHVPAFAEELVDALRGGSRPDLLHSHYWLSGWAAAAAKRALGLPLANSFHTLGKVKEANRHPAEPPESLLRIMTEAEVIEASDCIVTATPYEFDDLLTHYGASPERLCISPPGVDHRVFTPGDPCGARRRLGFDTAPLLLFVGRLQRHKGPDVAAAAHARVAETIPDARLVFVGGPSGADGDETVVALEKQIAASGTKHLVTFHPPVPHVQLPDWYRAADVLLMPSRSESFGLVAAEAQACGLPVVASRVGGIPHVVRDAESGILVDDHDVDDFAAACVAILENPAFRAELSAGAVRFASGFTWRRTVDRLLELYRGIVG